MHIHLSFRAILFLAYIVPNIYVFFRLWHLFIWKEFRFAFALIYIVLAILYPAGNMLHHNAAVTKVLTFTTGYLVPFYLYLFLSLIIIDILLLINRLIKTVPREKLKETGIKKKGLAAILLFSAVVVAGGIINYNIIRTSFYHIEIPRRSSKLEHLRIAFASDLHLQESTGIGFVRRFTEKIREVKADLMIFGGDVVQGNSDVRKARLYTSLLSSIHARYGVFTVLGNHEFYSRQETGNFFDQAGMKVLRDTIIVIDSSFALAGRYDSNFTSRKSVDELLRNAPGSLPLILVDHRPTDIDRVSLTKTDVQLSGHTHNGQLFPINLITGMVYRLSWGYLKLGNTHFFVSSGAGLWGPPVRTTGKSEIMVIDIDFR